MVFPIQGCPSADLALNSLNLKAVYIRAINATIIIPRLVFESKHMN